MSEKVELANPGRGLRYKEILKPEDLLAVDAVVVGVGAVGRQVAWQLASIGVGKVHIVDPDTVGEENLGPQGYFWSDVGKPKVEATAEFLRLLNRDILITVDPGPFCTEQPSLVGKWVFCCVDNMDVRKAVWEAASGSRFFADARCAAETCNVFAVGDPSSEKMYQTTLFPQSEAAPLSCSSRMTLHNAVGAAVIMMARFRQRLTGQDVIGHTVSNWPDPMMYEGQYKV